MAIELHSWVLVTDASAPSYERVGQVISVPVSTGAVVELEDRKLYWVDTNRMTRLHYTVHLPLLGLNRRSLNAALCVGNSSTSAAVATSGAAAPFQAGEATRSFEPLSCSNDC